MLTVVLLKNYPPDNQQSMLRFGDALHRELRDQQVKVLAWSPPQLLSRWSGLERGSLGKWLGYIDKFVFAWVSLAALRARHPSAVWHIVDHSNALYAYALPPKRVLATCHDCIAIEEVITGKTGEPTSRLGALLQAGISSGLRRCTKVVAVSAATASDLMRLVHIDARKIQVVHNGLLAPYRRLERPEAISRLKGSKLPLDRPFVFMIGSNVKRKNRAGGVRIFEQFRQTEQKSYLMVLAGKRWATDLRAQIAASPYAYDIVETGPLTDDQLEAAYSLADLVIFPSLAEGFGLPVIEAQACGAPVVASNIEPMPEVGGDGALYADPANPVEFADAMRRALQQPAALADAAQANVKRFEPALWAWRYSTTYSELSSETHK